MNGQAQSTRDSIHSSQRNCIAVPDVKIKKKKTKILKNNCDTEKKVSHNIIKVVLDQNIPHDITDKELSTKKSVNLKETIKKIFEGMHFEKVKAILPMDHLNRLLSKISTFFEEYVYGKIQISSKISQKKVYVTGGLIAGVALCVVVVTANFASGYEVFMGDKPMGIVYNRQEFDRHINTVKEELNQSTGMQVVIDQQPRFIHKLIRRSSLTKADILEKNLKSVIDETYSGYVILVDGKQLAAVKDENTAKSILDTIKKQYSNNQDENITVDFNKDVQIQQKTVKLGEIQAPENALAILSGTENEVKTYTVQEKDTLWSIARNNNMLVDEIVALNPGINETIKPGQMVKLNQPKPVLEVKTSQTVVYNEEIPYEVKTIDDPDTYEGNQSVVEEGADGQKQVQAEVVKVNGNEVSRQVLNEVVLAEPKAQTVKVGTKPQPPKSGTGTFSRPSFGVLTSRFGPRSRGMHTGIDLASKMGDPIHAADGGTIIWAGWEGNYGNLVKIDHGNGFVTYYGHCSKLLVKVGDRVAKGDEIAKVGSTGNSTGPHVHFEVRKNGTPQDPLMYLK